LAPKNDETELSVPSSESVVKATSSTQIQSTSSSKSSVSSVSTAESNYNINNRLDELASNLDPWAHIQHAQHKEDLEKEATSSTTTTTTVTTTTAATTTTTTSTTTTTTAEKTTKLSLFTIKTTDTTTTISTTTFKAKSLHDLIVHRNGGVTSKYPAEEENTILPILETTTKTTTRKPYTPRKLGGLSLRDKFRPKRPQKESDEVRTQKEEKQHLIAGKNVPETNRISGSFKDRHKLKELPIKKDDVSQFLPEGYKPSQRTSANIESDALLRELLKDLKEKDLDKLIPNCQKFSPSKKFTPESTTSRGFTKAVKLSDTVTVEDISKFLPKGYEPSTTPEPYKLEINNLFENVDIPASLLPKDYKPEPVSNSKNTLPKGLKIQPEEISLDLLPKDYPKSGLKISTEEVPANLLPKGYDKNKLKIKEEELPASLLLLCFDLR